MTNNDPTTMFYSLFKDMPEVNIKKKFHNTSFLVGKKVFAFTKGDGLVMKLPKEKIKELLDKDTAKPLAMGKRVMKEWVIIKYKDLDKREEVCDLLKDSITFVSSK